MDNAGDNKLAEGGAPYAPFETRPYAIDDAEASKWIRR
jgi:hypothetical protein